MVRAGWKRRLLSGAIGSVAPVALALAGGVRLRIVNYHRINYPSESFPLDEDVISATPEAFERQLRFCRAHFDVITFRDLAEACTGVHALPRRPLILTFDDGYEDNYRYAYPLLRAHRLSAMFFLATSYVGTERLFWWDEVASALNRARAGALDVAVGSDLVRLDLGAANQRRASRRLLLKRLKSVPNAERERCVAALVRDTSPAPSTRQALTWAEVREMRSGGMEIGSHSKTHPVLSQVAPEQLHTEVSESKAEIEARIGESIDVFSYPVGGPAAINDSVTRAVNAAGYGFAVSYVNGTNPVGDRLDRYRMKRLHVDGLGDHEFRMRLAAPTL